MSKYTLVKNPLGVGKALSRDGLIMQCPFQPALISTTTLGTEQILRMPCCDTCPLFEMHEKHTLQLLCSKHMIVIDIEEDEPAAPQSPILKAS